jgi:hypothetical protein
MQREALRSLLDRIDRRNQLKYGLGSQSQCPYRGKWGKGKEDAGTGNLYVHTADRCGSKPFQR